ncbi:hypothetical protein PMPD1_2964 [Paramixta manurensis]|uniref:Ig-like domain repeat protein n=1 Tax=Paramixta manurensis TaxID=2740817 RepID=A0A6M8UB02_9GAMM|nr:hypothetical protein PMPD1_2964 [Erwiniaceae bacterium PD-1]
MAQLNQGRVDIISRENGTFISQTNGGFSHTVALNEASVVRINGTQSLVTTYERQGNDLILHMRDGSVVRYQRFFFNDTDGLHSELVFDDGTHLPVHALFPAADGAADATALVAVTPTYESLNSIDPLLLADNDSNTGVITAAGLGVLGLAGIGIAASGGGGGHHHNNDNNNNGGNGNNGNGGDGNNGNGGNGNNGNGGNGNNGNGGNGNNGNGGNGNGGDGEGGNGNEGNGANGTPTLNLPFGDGTLNSGEAGSDQTLSGNTGVSGPNQTVTVTLGDHQYTGTPANDGSWTITLPSGDLQDLPQGNNQIVVVVTDPAGNSSTSTTPIVVDTIAPTLTVNPIAADGMLNAQEQSQPLEISGSGEANDTVTVTLNGHTYTTTVGDNGQWSVAVPATDLAELSDGSHPVAVSISDAAGNSTNQTAPLTVKADEANLPSITVNTFAGNNILDGAEQHTTQTLSGTTQHVEAGQTVTVTLDGQNYTAVVQPSGDWSVQIPSSALLALENGTATIHVVVNDIAGNSADNALEFTVNNAASGLSVNPLSDDGYLNASEANENLVVSGTSSNIPVGNEVTVTFNGQTYTAEVADNGNWSITIPAADLAGLPDGAAPLTVTAIDTGGNPVDTSATLNVIVHTLPEVTLQTPFGDGALNAAESATEQTLQGETGVSGDGQSVTVSLGGSNWTGSVDGDGHWSVTLPADALQALAEGGTSIVVTVSDAAGNQSSTTAPVVIDRTAPTLAVDPVAGDGIVNAVEAAQPITIGGSSDAPQGQTVTVTLNGETYTTEVDAQGHWSVELPAGTLLDAEPGSYPLTVTVSDAAGNPISTTSDIQVATASLAPTIDTPFGDGYLNIREAQDGQTLSGSTGSTSEGQTVTVNVGGTEYPAVVDAQGNWSVALDAETLQGYQDGALPITVTVTDAAGNMGSVNSTVSVDYSAPTLNVGNVAGDNIINRAEALQAQTISGTASPADAGQTVQITFNGETLQAVVQNDGSWSVTLPASALQGLADGEYHLGVTLTDAAGNPASIDHLLTLAASPASQPTLSIDAVTGDDYINRSEAAQGISISGSATGLETGQTVTVTLNGQNYTTTVTAQGDWRVDVPAQALGQLSDGRQTITVTASDVAGNPASATHDVTVVAGAASQPVIEINTVAGDDVVNAQEAQQPLVISGTSQHLDDGASITVSLNGKTYSATVDAEGNWSATVPAQDVQALTQGDNHVTATATDIAGNPADDSHDFSVDTQPPALLDIDLGVGSDGILNLAEAVAGITIGGTTDAGLTVTLTLNDKTYTATADTQGHWSVALSSGDLLALADGTAQVGLSVTDASGNTASQLVDLNVAINTLPALTLDTPLFGDGLLNVAEADGALTLTGTATHLEPGTEVTVTIGNLTFSGTVATGGRWEVSIPAGALSALPDGNVQVEVSAVDAAGNPAGIAGNVEIVLSTLPEAAIQVPFVDGALNAAEADSDQVIRGTTGISGEGQQVSVVITGLNNDQPLTATVDAGGHWSLNLSPSQLADLANGSHTITATVTDRAGNSDSASLDFNSIINGLPDPTLNTPFTDGILNLTEAQAGGALSGVTGITGEQTVIVTVNGTGFEATVDEETGQWSLDLPASELQTLPDGNWPIEVSVTDSVGNSATIDGALQVAIHTLPVVTINLPFGDGSLNIIEATLDQQITGRTGITSAGQTVSVVISGLNNGDPFEASVDANGNWSLNLSPQQLASLSDGTHTIEVTATDAAGNSATQSLEVIAALTPADPVINPPFGDGILNIDEAAGAVILTGTTGLSGENQGVQITIDLGGITYTGTVDAEGNWSVGIPAGALGNLNNGTHTIDLTIVDAAGNVTNDSLVFTAALTAPTPTLNVPFGDSLINLQDVEDGATLTGTTGTTGDAQSVTVNVGGTDYTATLNGDGSWSLALSSEQLNLLDQGDNTLSVRVVDSNGNATTIGGNFTVDTVAPTVNIDPFTGDNSLTYAESILAQTLSGSAGVENAGSTVTVTLGASTLTGIVDDEGNWQVAVMPGVMAQLANGSDTITVTITDPAGNSNSASTTLTVDLTPPDDPLLTLDPIGGDNILNASETGSVTVTGSFSHFLVGSTVNITVNGVLVGTDVVVGSEGNWSVNLPAAIFGSDGNYTVSASAVVGLDTVSTGATVVVDRTAPELTINAFTADNVLNESESGVTQTLSGTASISEAGRTVTLTLNGKTYTAVVQANGNWSTNIAAADLQALQDGPQTLHASLSDRAGNLSEVDHNFTVDTGAPLLQVDALLGNNVLNAADILLTQTLTGTASGAEGQTIGLYLGDANPIATAVVNADGTFALQLTPEVLDSLTEGALVFGVRVSDAAGNQTDATLTVNKIINQGLTLIVDSVFGDGTLSALDSTVAQTISGVAKLAGIGATVTLDIGDTTLSAKVGQDGKWAIIVPPNILGLLADGDINLNLTLSDAAGNTRTVGETVTAIIHNLPVIGDLSHLFGVDNLLNIGDLAQNQTIGGLLNAATGSTVIVTLGSKSYQTQVTAGGQWGLTIPALDLGHLLDGTLSLGVKVIDPAGNVASSAVDVGIFGTAPSISLSPIFGDGILNALDLVTGQTISGVVNHVAAGAQVTISIGNSTVTAVVGQNGAFSATVSPDILGTLLNGNLTVGVSVTDAAGNTTSTSAGLVVNVTIPGIELNPIFGDGLLNAADALLTQVISGHITNATPGSKVEVTLAGQHLITTANANGDFSVALSPAILQGLLDGNLTVGIKVTDSAGNSAETSAGVKVGIHNLPVITLDPLFGDGVLNLLESIATQTITGQVANAAAGSVVTVNIGNSTVTAAVDDTGHFSAQVSPDILGTLLNGNLTVGVSVTDAVGNTASVSAGVQIGINTPPTLTVNTLFGDGVLSAVDLNSAQTISGSSSHLSNGTLVTVTLGGKTYTAQVGSNGNWTLSVPKADLALLSDGTLAVEVRATDAFGNEATGSGALNVIAHTPPTVTIATIFGDGQLNATDVLSAQTIVGTSTNAEGSTIQVAIGGQTFTGTVGADGSWSVSVPAASLATIADGTQTVTASVTNLAGGTGSDAGNLLVGTHTLPSVTLGTLFGGDGFLNLAEAANGETISGNATNAQGSSVAVTIAGTTFTTTVGAEGSWSITIPAETLQALSDGSHSLSVTLTDAVGNISTANSSFNAVTHNLPIIGVDPVLSLVSVLLTGLTISGGTLNLKQGTMLNVTLNGHTQQTTTDALGRYSIKFAGGLLTALSLSSIVTVTAVDAAGNPAATSTTLLLGSLLPVAASAEVHSAALVAVDDSGTASAGDQSHSVAAPTASEQKSTAESAHTEAVPVASTLVTETDSAALSVSDTHALNAPVAHGASPTESTADEAYSIGGVTIVLADGSMQEGAFITGSQGEDTVTLNTLNFGHIDGGSGVDTLVLNGEHMTLDLTSLGLKIENVEVLDLGKSGTNGIKLDLHDALTLTDTPQDDLLIKGADGGEVTLANTEGGVWSSTGQRTVEGHTYDVYHNSALTADNTLGDVLIQHNLQVHVV